MSSAHRLACIRVRQRGLTLLELMISLVLGLILVGGIVSVVTANSQINRSTQALSQLQESARMAFELLARDIREAGGTGCSNGAQVANIVRPAGLWWQQDWTGVRGYTGAQAAPGIAFHASQSAQRVNGTDAITVQGLAGTGVALLDQHVPVGTGGGRSVTLQVDAPFNFQSGDIALICDGRQNAIFQVSATNFTNPANLRISFDNLGTTPGNCAVGLGFPTECPEDPTEFGAMYTFGMNAQLTRMGTTTWFIGNNGRPEDGGRSLYRRSIVGGGATLTEEMVPGVTAMQLSFRPDADSADLVPASAVTNWNTVTAVEATLTLTSVDVRVGTNTAEQGRLQRSFTTLIGVRNRLLQ